MDKQSIIQYGAYSKYCYACGNDSYLHKYYVFDNIEQSKKDGCWCWLCGYHYNESAEAVNNNTALSNKIKSKCQEAWEQKYGTRQDFIKKYGVNLL